MIKFICILPINSHPVVVSFIIGVDCFCLKFCYIFFLNSRKELEAHKINHEKDTRVQYINALHDICSYIYTHSLRSYSKFSGVIIAALDLIKTHRILLQPLGISYNERDLTKTSNYLFFEFKKEVIRILINVNCNQNLEIILDIRNFAIDKIIKFTLDDKVIKDFKSISDILQCLHSRIK